MNRPVLTRRQLLLSGAAIAITGAPARAFLAPTSAPDPYVMTEYVFNSSGATIQNSGNKNLASKTPVVLNPSANNCVLVTFGDSLGENIVPTAFTPTNTNVLNFNIYNGGTYALVDPVLGASGPIGALSGNMFTRVANNIQGTGKFTNTILVNGNVGGTLMSNWAIDQFSRIRVAFARLAAAGLTATAVAIELGANDTPAGTSQATYAAQQAAMVAIIRLYYAGPIFIATESYFAGATSAAVQAAQAAAVNHGSGIWAGPNGDSLTSASRQSADNIHWNDTGSAAMAALWLTSLQAFGPPFT